MEDAEQIKQELAMLERENARLRARLRNTPFASESTNPTFNALEFRKALYYYVRISLLGLVPVQLAAVLLWLRGGVPKGLPSLGPIPFFDFAGLQSGIMPGIGIGLVAIGGLAVGLIAFGGMAVGVFAFGGGSLGVFAFGGGAIGVIAVGGGAVGLVSLGGGGAGIYVCAERGAGRYVFSVQRQDDRAVEFFTRWLPRLKKALVQPLPVVRIDCPRI
ncbi:MAG: hypothetical protein HBSAPP02_20620 [Phycisphaerae bacterium]|nr:MAG: hypothetical protein HRU71_05240 [Planctomycetia bacterium]RIK69955.1 MAG: hypothetical protein DCC66_07010 [Planctomycetota bacterium]GJQ27030.1 MAG: hypothetical protein HBSAPP02_20620 [Phycisphaerae bacterium]